MNKQTKHFYEFGEFRLEPARRKFYQGEEVVALTPKVFDLLLVLLQNQGQVLEKRYLLEQVWSDVIVEEHSLTQGISVLRKILGDKPNSYNYIKTVPGHGYQFIAPVNEVFEEDEPGVNVEPVNPRKIRDPRRTITTFVPVFVTRTLARRAYLAAVFLVIGILAGILPPWLSSKASRMSSQQLTSVAVKPFHAVDKESCKTGLTGILTDALVTKLSRLDGVTVRPLEHSCSSREHSKTAQSGGDKSALPGHGSSVDTIRDLGVEAVIEGQVQKQAEKFRVSVRMTRTSDGVTLWADQIETDHPNDGAIQDRVSALVAEAITTTAR